MEKKINIATVWAIQDVNFDVSATKGEKREKNCEEENRVFLVLLFKMGWSWNSLVRVAWVSLEEVKKWSYESFSDTDPDLVESCEMEQ